MARHRHRPVARRRPSPNANACASLGTERLVITERRSSTDASRPNLLYDTGRQSAQDSRFTPHPFPQACTRYHLLPRNYILYTIPPEAYVQHVWAQCMRGDLCIQPHVTPCTHCALTEPLFTPHACSSHKSSSHKCSSHNISLTKASLAKASYTEISQSSSFCTRSISEMRLAFATSSRLLKKSLQLLRAPLAALRSLSSCTLIRTSFLSEAALS